MARGYPRPQLERPGWISLDGFWAFGLDPDAVWARPEEVSWEGRILVPFAVETVMSGIGETGFFRACWYRRTIDLPTRPPGHRVVLHFGAVDYAATVWVQGKLAGYHEGGYTPFRFDITDLLDGDRGQEIVVRAYDDPHDLQQPRGKQDWQRAPHAIWYPRTTGIWQTVWLEVLPPCWIERLRVTPNLDRWELGLLAELGGVPEEGLRLAVKMSMGDEVLADDAYLVVAGVVHRRIALSDPGIDDSRNAILWSPESPTLIRIHIRLLTKGGELVDEVRSYAALRELSIQGDRVVLNGRAYHLRMVLDQGYWPETGLTPPDDAALERDVKLAKAMGFNGVRKHQKIEDPRYLYWADHLGLLVWEEMPSAYRFTPQSVMRLKREWEAVIERDYSHPCIAAWVPFNESWGVPNLPDNPSQRHYVKTLYHLTKTLDPTRPVIGNDGWESVATDIIGIHDYDSDPSRIGRRYYTDEVRPRLFKQERPGGRILLVEGHSPPDHPVVLSEFGGIALEQPDTWGYSRCASAEAMAKQYQDLLEVVHSLQLLAGFCYTQFADTYQEANGLLTADRTPKIPIEQIRRANVGSVRPPFQDQPPGP